MNTGELKFAINEYLSQIEDVSFLNAIKTIIESKISEGKYQLSDYQVKRVEKGREQLKNDETVSNQALKKEIDQWLSTK